MQLSTRARRAIAAARTALSMQPDLPVANDALQYAFVSKGMRDEHLALQREHIARDPELVAAFEQGLSEANYEGAIRSIADLRAARLRKIRRHPGHRELLGLRPGRRHREAVSQRRRLRQGH